MPKEIIRNPEESVGISSSLRAISLIQRSDFLFFEQDFDRAHDPLNHTNKHEMSLVLFRVF
jgi:hypothetical protein